MARFDWKRFCERNHIEYVTSGPNTARGNISIHCPFCGSADPSQHLGLKLDVRDPQWGCFRNAAHRGKAPARLVARLLNISQGQAEKLVEDSAPPVEALGETLHRLRHGSDAPDRARSGPRRVVPLTEFRLLADAPEPPTRYQQPFFDYLSRRGFGNDARDVARRYRLWYALTGEQAHRLIFPVYDEQAQLIGWTGREIRHGGTPVRYLAKPEMGKDVLLTSPRSEPADVLVICEGPVDFLKVDYYGREYGVEAVGTMGTAVTPAQLAAIIRKQRTKRKTWALFDTEALAQNLRLTRDLSGFAGVPKFSRLPDGYGDPGEMSATATRRLCSLLSAR